MVTFWNLLERSIIVQSLVTLMLTSAVVYMYVVGHEVPSDLVNLNLLVLGFWFGTKIQAPIQAQQIQAAIQEAKKNVSNC